jgi:nucleoside 2-deoxyribosyltransferase
MSKLVYIAGPYRGPDYLSIDANIAKAREAAACLAREGIAFISPHLNSCHFEVITPEVPEGWWLAMTLELMKRCDAVWVLEGHEESQGTRDEVYEAEVRGMPVWFAELVWSMDALKAWVKEPTGASA